MEPRNWKRPRNPESYDNRFSITDLDKFENRWSLVIDRLKSREPDPGLSGSQP